MRKIIIALHTTLDGFVAGPNGEMDWINLDDTMFDLVGKMTDDADTALYGRVTFEMMNSYWPTAADSPNPTKHDIEHSTWYNKVPKIVLSKTMTEADLLNVKVISNDVKSNITKIKNEEGKNILIFGSPRAFHSLFNDGLIDEIWLFVNPIVLGKGIPVFNGTKESIKLKFLESKSFSCGVIGLHYEKV
jgi:dihydrofolate reductase